MDLRLAQKNIRTLRKKKDFNILELHLDIPELMGKFVERFICKLSAKQRKLPIFKRKQDLRGTWAIQDMLMAYRNTPRPATGVSPYQDMMYRSIRTKLGHTIPERGRSKQEKQVDEKDRQYKEKMKREDANVKEHNFILGDYVLLRQRIWDKWSTPYEPVF